jgi:LDH2 family malate/lactate/ureidoglycolate dehydrogenase
MAKADSEGLAKSLRALAASERIAYPEFLTIVTGIFARTGLSEANAASAAEVALYPQLAGSDSHGVVTMPLYLIGLLDGTIKPDAKFSISHQDGKAAAVIDADNGLGLIAGRQALDMACDMAKGFGLGAVAVRNSSHFGAAGYYADRAAARGLIALSFSNAAPAIAPTEGVEALLGTNPISASIPLEGRAPIVLDMATSMAARSRIRQSQVNGETIPEGWAIDAEGFPTTDPAAAIAGSVLPIGGPKGYGLALLVELLCSGLSDGEPGLDITYENVVKRPSRTSHFFLAIDPDAFAGSVAFDRRTKHIAAAIEGSKGRAGGPPPRLPGARAQASRAALSKQGIPLQQNLRAALNQSADILERYGVGG